MTAEQNLARDNSGELHVVLSKQKSKRHQKFKHDSSSIVVT